jgi:hypothetical protein
MTEKAEKKRSAPKAKANTRRQSIYAKVLDEAEKLDFEKARGIDGIDEEIALIRLEIKKAIVDGDDRSLQILVKATNALDRLIRTRYQITAAQRKGLKEAISNVIKDVLVPLGVNVGSAVITKKVSG